jgi:hypothetical protein
MKIRWTRAFWIKFLFTRLPWVLLTAFFGYLTAKTSGVIFLEFVTGQTSATVTSVFAKYVSLPNTTLCIPMLTSELYKIPLTEGKQSESYYQDFVASGIDSGEFWKEKILYSNWSRTLLYVTHQYLACMTAFEFFEDDKSACFENETGYDLFEAWNSFAKQLQISNVTTDDLRQKFGREIAVAYSLSVTKESVVEPKSLIVDTNTITYVNWYYACFRMRFDLHRLQRGIRNSFIIEATPPLTDYHHHYMKSVLTNAPSIHFDIRGRAAITFADLMDNSLVLYANFLEHHIFVPITLTAVFQALPFVNGTQRCSDYQSVDACQAECKAAYIREVCNCTSTVKNYPAPNAIEVCTNRPRLIGQFLFSVRFIIV